MPAKKNDSQMQSLTPVQPPEQDAQGEEDQTTETTGQSQDQTPPQPEASGGATGGDAGEEGSKPQGMTNPEGGYKATSNIGTGNAESQELPNGSAVRQGPKGPMHKHPGYQDSEGHLKWHLASQRHGWHTRRMHEDAGLGSDGLGSTPEMRMAVGANMKEGGGLIQPPESGMNVGAKVAAHAGLAALESISGLAGKGMSAVTRFTRAVLSGNPLSPASSLLADTFDGMASVKRSLDDTYRKYGIDPGADMKAVGDTIRGSVATRQVEARNAGYNRAFDNVDQRLADIAGSPDADITQLGPEQLDLYYRTLSEDADKLLQDYNDARESGTLTPELQMAYDAELEVYASAFGVIAEQGDANKRKYAGLAKELKAQRSSEKAKEREAKEREKQALQAKHEKAYQEAIDTGDFATKVMYDLGDKFYDAERTPNGVLVDSAMRARYEKALQDKIDSGQYSDEEVKSMQTRLNDSKLYSYNQKLKEKKDKRTTAMEMDWGADGLNVVDAVYDRNNALGRTNQHGVVVGDKMSPRLHNDLYTAAEDRIRALVDRGMSEEEARKDPEVRRALTASRLQEWTYDAYKILPELTRIPYAKLEEKGKTIEDVDEAKRKIYDEYNKLMDRYSFVTDDPKSWNGELPTSEDRENFKHLVDSTRREFGIWKERKGEGEAKTDESKILDDGEAKPVDIWLSDPTGITPTGQRIQSGRDPKRSYSPDDIQMTAGKLLTGNRTNAQSLMIARFKDDNPSADMKNNMSNPSYNQRKRVMDEWGDAIEEMRASGDPMKMRVADEMSKYLEFTHQVQAWYEFVNEAPVGSALRNKRKEGFKEFMDGEGREWTDPEIGGINLDDIEPVEDRVEQLEEFYKQLESQDPLENQDTGDEKKKEDLGETVNDEKGEGEPHFDFSSFDDDQLDDIYEEIFDKHKELYDKARSGNITEGELKQLELLTLQADAVLKEQGRRQGGNDTDETDDSQDDGSDDAETDDVETVDDETEDDDDNDHSDEVQRYGAKVPRTYDELTKVLDYTEGKHTEGRINVRDLSDRDLEMLKNRYLAERQKLPDAERMTPNGEAVNEEQFKKWKKLNPQFKKVKKELERRARIRNKEQQKIHEADAERIGAEKRKKGKDQGEGEEETPKKPRKTNKDIGKGAHVELFSTEDFTDDDPRWDKLKKKDPDSIAGNALRFDPDGENGPIISDDKAIEGKDISKTINMMKESSMALRRYLIRLAQEKGDEDAKNSAYDSDNPWRTASEFIERYGESDPDGMQDLKDRVQDSYEAVRERFEQDVDPQRQAHADAEKQRKQNLKDKDAKKPRTAQAQARAVKEAYSKTYNSMKGLWDGYAKSLARLSRDDPTKKEKTESLNNVYRDITAKLDSVNKDAEMSYEDKIQAFSDIEEEGKRAISDLFKSMLTLDMVDFSILPNELRKSFTTEFDRLTDRLGDYVWEHFHPYCDADVDASVNIMLRHPEQLEKSHRPFVEKEVGEFYDRVSDMLFRELLDLSN